VNPVNSFTTGTYMTINWTLIEQIDFGSSFTLPAYSAIYIDFTDLTEVIVYTPFTINANSPAVAEYIVTSGGPPGPITGSNITFSVCVNDIINFTGYDINTIGPLKLRIHQIGNTSSPSPINVIGYSFIADWSAITTNGNSPHFATATSGQTGP
jgi:hypothetical protein